MNSTFVIMCCNTAHPSGELKYFLSSDEDDNTLHFDSEQDAKSHIKENGWQDGPIMYAVLDVAELSFKLV
jgi:hypothetical protein